MSLASRLTEDMKAAMKAREAGRLQLSVIRLAKAAIKNQEIAKGHELNDAEIIEVLAREAKMRRDTIPEYEKASRLDTVETLKQEIAILMEYLPKQMSETEIIGLVKRIAADTGAQSPKDMGMVMGKIVPLTKGKADGRLVNEIVRKVLAGEM